MFLQSTFMYIFTGSNLSLIYKIRGSIPSTDVGKEQDRDIFAAVPAASVHQQTACKNLTSASM